MPAWGMVIFSPGSGPVPNASEEQAADNLATFVEELRTTGVNVVSSTRVPSRDYGEGRWAFELTTDDARRIEVQMPGIQVDLLHESWSRLYIDGSSWEWEYALLQCRPAE